MIVILSSHFTLKEAEKSETADKLGIDNSVKDETILENLERVAVNILEPCRAHYGVPIMPSSWYRCKELNKAVGGVSNSQHMIGEAVDFEVSGIDNMALGKFIKDNLEYDQLIWEFYKPGQESSGWIHISFRASNNRHQDFHINDNNRSSVMMNLNDSNARDDTSSIV